MKKMFVITIILICTISPLVIISSQEVKKETKNITKISDLKISGCYSSYYGHGEKVEQGYATLLYTYLLKNPKNNHLEFEINWGDGTLNKYQYSSDSIYVPHQYKKSGTYSIKVRYSMENKWSEPFNIEMIDFYDINVKNIYSKSSNFRPRQKVSLCVDLENIGTIPTSRSSKIVFYHIKDNNKKIIAESNVGIIQPGDTQTVEVLFRWFNDKDEHTIFVEVQEVNFERTNANNIKYERLAAQGIISSLFTHIKSRINGFLEGYGNLINNK